MNRSRSPKFSAFVYLGLTALCALCCAGVSRAATPFDKATVTRLQNKVNYGERRGERSETRAASVADVVRADSFLLTETDSRAELQYPDGTLVRIGQNTIFTFAAETRTLTLEKGSLLFHIPKGSGGGTIKTPSLTAAITGTAGKVSPNIIAIVEGVVKLVPSGQLVHAGEFARRNPDGTITIAKFDPDKALDGILVTFNGLMPGFDEAYFRTRLTLGTNDILELMRQDEVLYRTQNLPGSIEHFFPTVNDPPPADRSNPRVFVPPPNNPPAPPPPTRGGGTVVRGNY